MTLKAISAGVGLGLGPRLGWFTSSWTNFGSDFTISSSL